MVVKMNLVQASKISGCPVLSIRNGAIQKSISWAAAVKGKGRYSYYVYPGKFAEAYGLTMEQLAEELANV